jgi:NAD(P)-dependent dehydrogenase (short-subunit alcohol dehydrogenase family)
MNTTFSPGLFKGKTVVVSGGTSGIGLAIANGFAALDADVVAAGSSQAKIDDLNAGDRTSGLRFAQWNVRDAAGAKRLFAELGRLDVLVNAAGIARPHAEFEDETWDEVIDVNLSSVMRNSMAARPLLAKQGGAIINVASMLSYVVDPAVPAYGASKTGVLGLTRHLSHALAAEGIRVNAVTPGYHQTDMTKGLWTDPDASARIVGRTALKRWGSAEDVVGATLFLASPAASYITGTDIAVDGGFVNGGL